MCNFSKSCLATYYVVKAVHLEIVAVVTVPLYSFNYALWAITPGRAEGVGAALFLPCRAVAKL